jgi:hypothetical protein
MESETNAIAPQDAKILLDSLCRAYGFCLTPLWSARLTNYPPQSVQKYTDTIFLAEGLDPRTADSDLYKSILSEVREAFSRSSTLPGHDA